MRLITETMNNGIEVIFEAAKDGKKKNYFLEGIFLQADVTNKNNRVYPADILFKETKRYQNEMVTQNRSFGELGHPSSPMINLDRVSHMVKSL